MSVLPARPVRRLLVCIAAVLAAGLIAAPGAVESASAQVASAQPATANDDSIEAAVDVLEAFMDSTRVPGLSGAVAVGGEVVWSGGFGHANLQHRVPATAETRYRIASISKPIAATAAMTLVEAGRLDLDAPIRSLLPLFPEKRGPVTMRQLLSHTAGIRHYRGDEFESDRRYESRIGPVGIFADDSLLFEPGTRFSYSTYGFTLASAGMEAAADSSFLELMQAHIAGPLGLETLVAERTERVIPNEASFYRLDTTGGDTTIVNAPYVDNSNKWAGGGLLAAPGDLVRFAAGLNDGRILEPATVDSMFAAETEIEDQSVHYGLGWFGATDDAGRQVVWHSGGAMGGSGVLVLYPEHGLAIATLSNLGGVPHRELAIRMAKVLLPE